jgi:hypothetical protein
MPFPKTEAHAIDCRSELLRERLTEGRQVRQRRRRVGVPLADVDDAVVCVDRLFVGQRARFGLRRLDQLGHQAREAIEPTRLHRDLEVGDPASVIAMG